MKHIIKYSLFFFFIFITTSCLDSNLEDLPTFDEADITKVDFEYRWLKDGSNYAKLQVMGLKTVVEVDTLENSITCSITVPAAKNEFTDSIRTLVDLDNIVGIVDLSTAASIRPIGDAPKLGAIGDFSKQDLKYEVTAANGLVKVWTVQVNELIK